MSRSTSEFHVHDVVASLALDQLAVRIDAGAGRLVRHDDADGLLAGADAMARQVARSFFAGAKMPTSM